MTLGDNRLAPLGLIKEANKFFRAGKYSQALHLYNKIIEEDKNLAKLFEVNLFLAKKRGGVLETSAPANPEWRETGPAGNLTYENAFDSNWYLEQNPDVNSSILTPFEHYREWGWKEGRWPNSWFDPLFYHSKYPDVKESQLEPLRHYVEFGHAAARQSKEIAKRRNISDDIPRVPFSDVPEGFVEYKKYPQLDCALKCIAFYLPQFHPFPENDEWWGKGFTEWTNVTKAKPNYEGHYQPHLPIHLGFYDLRIPEILEEQARLARNYGIHGFSIYYYWFGGKVLMHKPFEILLENKSIDINYCLTWANENWTRRWDGADHEVLIAQKHGKQDSLSFIKSLIKYFKDPRYITIDGKPVLLIYRPQIIPQITEVIELWKRELNVAGLKGLYLIAAQTFGFKDPREYGFDAAVEFPPHTVKSDRIEKNLIITNESFSGHIYSYEQSLENVVCDEVPEYKKYRTAMLSWDNTARKQNNSHIFHDFTLTRYKQWLDHICSKSNEIFSEGEKLVFINAWNEWAEGTHLEPDRRHGFGYLEATRMSLGNYDSRLLKRINKKIHKKNESAIVVHAHYIELWDDYNDMWKILNNSPVDVFVTVTSLTSEIVSKIFKQIPKANISIVENRGRDILPFIKTYAQIRGFKYQSVCKIHLKKSLYRTDGSKIRDRLYEALIGGENNLLKIIEKFKTDETLGCLVETNSLVKHTSKNMRHNRENVIAVASNLGFRFVPSSFPAGSMFWFRPDALARIEKVKPEWFEIERGLSDGTIAHAIERLFLSLCLENGFTVLRSDCVSSQVRG